MKGSVSPLGEVPDSSRPPNLTVFRNGPLGLGC